MKLLGMALLAGVLFVPAAKAAPVSPNFTNGTVTSHTESTTTVTEIINQIDYTTGTSYTVSGANIKFPGAPGPDCPYSILTQGGAFQFSETILGPGISRETFIERETTVFTVTDSVSVFTQ
jgi:hypothetical protein